ncbi:hypothetical protein, partial [Komagataeibacter saccharivorans]|uniref:hypothetical protein n=1 Tax=Komagataeibacter saccharivorans TaxID=265959 RepID=UPI0039EB38F2
MMCMEGRRTCLMMQAGQNPLCNVLLRGDVTHICTQSGISLTEVIDFGATRNAAPRAGGFKGIVAAAFASGQAVAKQDGRTKGE